MKKKVERLRIVNALIKEIASRGRKFFHHECKVANLFYINNSLYYECEYICNNRTHINTATFKGWYHGGTLKALIAEFRDFIKTGKQSDGSHGRAGLYCGHWGYPEEDMKAIRQLAAQLGYLTSEEVENPELLTSNK